MAVLIITLRCKKKNNTRNGEGKENQKYFQVKDFIFVDVSS